MATVSTNVFTKGFKGKFGDSLVFKTMRGKTFVSAPARKPDKKKESEAQRNTRVTFREATEWAQMILLDPEQKAYYRQRAKALKLPNAYTAAITDYMRKPKVVKTQNRDTITYMVSKPGFVLREVRATAEETTGAAPPTVVARRHKDRWLIHHKPDAGTVPSLTLIITDKSREYVVGYG